MVFFNQSSPESDTERKYKMIESIRESANTIHSFFENMEEESEDFGDLEVSDRAGE